MSSYPPIYYSGTHIFSLDKKDILNVWLGQIP